MSQLPFSSFWPMSICSRMGSFLPIQVCGSRTSYEAVIFWGSLKANIGVVMARAARTINMLAVRWCIEGNGIMSFRGNAVMDPGFLRNDKVA